MTTLTLRKANAVQLAIKDLLKSIKIITTINISEFEDHLVVIRDAQTLCQQEHNRKLKLLTALREIRKLVGAVNSTSGINEKLADVASIDKLIIHFDELINSPPHMEFSVIAGKLNKIKNQTDTNRWADDSVTSGILSLSAINEFKSTVMDLKKEKQILNDEILALNIIQTIQLTEEVETVLKAEKLI